MMKTFLLVMIIFYLPSTYALECQWWQTKIKPHQVRKYDRNGVPVSALPRQEHCRETWKHSDKVVATFVDSPPSIWTKEERFRPWTKKEMSEVLAAYEKLPEWLLFLHKSFHRAEVSSKSNKNPAAADKTTDSVTIYNEFYKRPNKAGIVGHEMAHLLFKRLSSDDIATFTVLAGWTLRVEGNQVYEDPPGKVLIKDSTVNKEEDFANLIAIYFTEPAKLKVHNPKLFDHFQERYPR